MKKQHMYEIKHSENKLLGWRILVNVITVNMFGSMIKSMDLNFGEFITKCFEVLLPMNLCCCAENFWSPSKNDHAICFLPDWDDTSGFGIWKRYVLCYFQVPCNVNILYRLISRFMMLVWDNNRICSSSSFSNKIYSIFLQWWIN